MSTHSAKTGRLRAAVAATRELLSAAHPGCFKPKGSPKLPLKLGIHRDVREAHPDLSSRLVWMTIEDYTDGETYLAHVVVGAVRVDLSGRPAGVVTEDEAAHAAEQLRNIRRRKAGQARQARQSRNAAAIAASKAPPAAVSTAPVNPSERKLATHDGYIWPVDRPALLPMLARVDEPVTAVGAVIAMAAVLLAMIGML